MINNSLPYHRITGSVVITLSTAISYSNLSSHGIDLLFLIYHLVTCRNDGLERLVLEITTIGNQSKERLREYLFLLISRHSDSIDKQTVITNSWKGILFDRPLESLCILVPCCGSWWRYKIRTYEERDIQPQHSGTIDPTSGIILLNIRYKPLVTSI